MPIWFETYDLNAIRQFSEVNALKTLGIELTEIGDDYLKGTMPVDERTKQPFGLLHGGSSCMLAESLASIAANLCVDPSRYIAVGLEINANHMRPVSDGTVTGICKPLHLGKTTHVWQIDMFTPDEKLFCSSRLTVAIRHKK